MRRHESDNPKKPDVLFRVLISLLILGHFFAIGSVVTSASGGTVPAPDLALATLIKVQPYIQFLMLDNAYRFYAPDPGPTDLLWFRLEHRDRSARWIEFPRRDDFSTRMTYQRRLPIPMLLGPWLPPNPRTIPPDAMQQQGDPRYRFVTPMAKQILGSFVRRMARIYSTDADNPVVEAEVYHIFHNILQPQQVQMEISQTDLRTYVPSRLGTYAADGSMLIDPDTELAEAIAVAGQLPPPPSNYFIASRIIEEQLWPYIDKHGEAAIATVGDLPGLPTPIRHLLARSPGLLKPDDDNPDLVKRIEDAVSKNDKLLTPPLP